MGDSGDCLLEKYDVIVLGTGLSESIVAAAVARAGKSILHLDSNDYYGSEWSSFWYTNWNDWIISQQSAIDSENRLYENVERVDYTDGKGVWSPEILANLSNKFSIDLTARLLYSSGPMTSLLRESNVCRYLSFKECTHFFLASCIDNAIHLKEVPCSRSDVFNDRSLSLIQKRKLMKFMDEFEKKSKTLDKPGADDSQRSSELDESFDELVKKHALDPLLVHLLRCVTLSQDKSSVREVAKKLNLFTQSAGRYGRTPFLWTLYGSGELPQAFCRLCAVFGGSYCLKCDLVDADFVNLPAQTDEAPVPETQEDGRSSIAPDIHSDCNIQIGFRLTGESSSDKAQDGRKVLCKYLVAGVNSSNSKFLKDLSDRFNCLAPETRKFFENLNTVDQSKKCQSTLLDKPIKSSHVVCIASKSIQGTDDLTNQVTFAIFPAGNYAPDIHLTSEVRLIQVSPSTCTVPSGLYLVHASCFNTSTDQSARQLLEPLISKIFTNASSFTESFTEEQTPASSTPHPVISCYYFDKLITNQHRQFLHQCRTLANTYLLSPPSLHENLVDYEDAIEEAKSVFHQMFPDCPFLPKAPDSEDIIFEDPEQDVTLT